MNHGGLRERAVPLVFLFGVAAAAGVGTQFALWAAFGWTDVSLVAALGAALGVVIARYQIDGR